MGYTTHYEVVKVPKEVREEFDELTEEWFEDYYSWPEMHQVLSELSLKTTSEIIVKINHVEFEEWEMVHYRHGQYAQRKGVVSFPPIKPSDWTKPLDT